MNGYIYTFLRMAKTKGFNFEASQGKSFECVEGSSFSVFYFLGALSPRL